MTAIQCILIIIMIKKIIVPIVIIAVFIGYIIYSRSSSGVAVVPSTPIVVNTSASSSVPKASYRNGTYTGSVADAFYGNLQVQAVIKDGVIADIQFLQYPDDSGNTRSISERSMPLLKSEAIAAQSAHVDSISGATQTSQAFQESLSAALSQAS